MVLGEIKVQTMELSKKGGSGGVRCAAKNCKNSYYNTNLKFFRFPKDVLRAKTWAIASDREDLLPRADTLNLSFRLCSAHFEKYMFTSHLQERLNYNAVPTLFTSLEGSSTIEDHTYSRRPMLKSLEESKDSVAPLYLQIKKEEPDEEED